MSDCRVMLLVGLAGILSAQTVSLAEPPYPNIFYAVDPSGKLIDLEHQTVTDFHTSSPWLKGRPQIILWVKAN
jgi:hypothetical protein